MFCDFQSISQYFKKLSRWFKCTSCVENPAFSNHESPLIILKCFWVANSFSFFFFSPHTESGILFFFLPEWEDWNVFPANVDFQNVCCWYADESVINRAEGWHSLSYHTPIPLSPLTTRDLCSLRKDITVRQTAAESLLLPISIYPGQSPGTCFNSQCLWVSAPLNTPTRHRENCHG